MRASLREINQIMQQFSGNAGAPEQHTEIMANLTAGSTVACRPDHHCITHCKAWASLAMCCGRTSWSFLFYFIAIPGTPPFIDDNNSRPTPSRFMDIASRTNSNASIRTSSASYPGMDQANGISRASKNTGDSYYRVSPYLLLSYIGACLK